MKTARCLTLFAISALVAACGGGGDGGGSAATASAPLAIALTTAVANIVNQNRTSALSVSGTATASGQTVNVTGSGTLTETTDAGTFEGTVGLRKTIAVNATLVGSAGASSYSAPLSATTQEYWDSNYKPLGATAAGSYCVTTSYVPVPATAQAGSNGNWYTQDCYSSSAKLTKISTISMSYTVEAETASTALLKVLVTSSATTGITLPSTRTYRVTSAGAVTRLTDVGTSAINGVTVALTMTYQ